MNSNNVNLLVFLAAILIAASCDTQSPDKKTFPEIEPEEPKVVTTFTRGDPLEVFPLTEREQAFFTKTSLLNQETLPANWIAGSPVAINNAAFETAGLDWEKSVGMINYGCSYVAQLEDRAMLDRAFSFSDAKPPHETMSAKERRTWQEEQTKLERLGSCDWNNVTPKTTFYRGKTYENEKWEIFTNHDARRTIGVYDQTWVVFSSASTLYALSNDSFLRDDEKPKPRADVFGDIAIFPYRGWAIYATKVIDGSFHVGTVPPEPPSETQAPIGAQAAANKFRLGLPARSEPAEAIARLVQAVWSGSGPHFYFSKFGAKEIFEEANPKNEKLKKLRTASAKAIYEAQLAFVETKIVSDRLTDPTDLQTVLDIGNIKTFLSELERVRTTDASAEEKAELVAELTVLRKEYQEKMGDNPFGLLGTIGDYKGGELKNIFGKGGLGTDIESALGGLRGTEIQDAWGSGGLGTRGIGSGGGGNNLGIGGLGGRGYGSGGFGYGNKKKEKSASGAGTKLGVEGGKEQVEKTGNYGSIDLGK